MIGFRRYDPAQVGPDGYPPIWHELKHQVREAAGFRCVRCLHPYRSGEHGSGEWSSCDERCDHGGPIRYNGDRRRDEAHWRILTVHHLDGDKCNLHWWNLAALCQRCHLTIQGKVVMDRVWPHEHSDWFRPYVAGYYAHRYLGKEVTREQAVERMDELLALETRQLSLDGAA